MTDTSRPWRPTPLLVTSAALHAGALGCLMAEPSSWPWVTGSLVADHLVMAGAGLWPRCGLLGTNWRHLPQQAAARGEVALTIDDGPDPAVTPRVLEILSKYSAKATFFCIGAKARQYPELCQEIVRHGHALENHSQNHRYRFSVMGLRGIACEVQLAQETITSITGQRPLFFRAPAGLRNPLLEPVLARHNLQLVSWTRRGFDTRENLPARVASRLLRDLKAGDILLLHDGNAATTRSNAPIILEVLPQLLDAVTASSLYPVTLREALA